MPNRLPDATSGRVSVRSNVSPHRRARWLDRARLPVASGSSTSVGDRLREAPDDGDAGAAARAGDLDDADPVRADVLVERLGQERQDLLRGRRVGDDPRKPDEGIDCAVPVHPIPVA